MTTTRVYLVEHKSGEKRLIRATSASQAIRHATGTDYNAKVAKQDALIAAIDAGCKVEIAGKGTDAESVTRKIEEGKGEPEAAAVPEFFTEEGCRMRPNDPEDAKKTDTNA